MRRSLLTVVVLLISSCSASFRPDMHLEVTRALYLEYLAPYGTNDLWYYAYTNIRKTAAIAMAIEGIDGYNFPIYDLISVDGAVPVRERYHFFNDAFMRTSNDLGPNYLLELSGYLPGNAGTKVRFSPDKITVSLGNAGGLNFGDFGSLGGTPEYVKVDFATREIAVDFTFRDYYSSLCSNISVTPDQALVMDMISRTLTINGAETNTNDLVRTYIILTDGPYTLSKFWKYKVCSLSGYELIPSENPSWPFSFRDYIPTSNFNTLPDDLKTALSNARHIYMTSERMDTNTAGLLILSNNTNLTVYSRFSDYYYPFEYNAYRITVDLMPLDLQYRYLLTNVVIETTAVYP